MMCVVSHVMLWSIHHAQHRYATRAYKTNDKYRSQHQEDDIEDTGVVPLYPLCNRSNVAITRNNTQRLKEKFLDIAHDFPAIVFAVDVKDGQDNQVCEDETDDSAEANATPPQHCCQRHVANGTHKTENSY